MRLFLWAIIGINDIRLSEWILGVRLKKWVCYVLWYISAFSSWTELWIHFETHFSLQKCPEASFPISNTIFRKCVVRVWCQLWTVKNWQPTKVALQNRWDISYHQTCLKRLTFSHLRDLFVKWYHVSFRIYHTLTLYMSPSSPVWRFKENLTHSILIFCWNKDISSHFSQELKTPTNAPPQKHCFTNLSVDHQKKCQGVCPHTE